MNMVLLWPPGWRRTQSRDVHKETASGGQTLCMSPTPGLVENRIEITDLQSCIMAGLEFLQSWVMSTNCCYDATWSVTSVRGGGRKIEPSGRYSMHVFFCKGLLYFKLPSSAALWGVLQRCEDLRLSQETFVCKSWRDWRYSNPAQRFRETATSKPNARMDAAPVQPTSALFWNKHWFCTHISALAKRPRLL